MKEGILCMNSCGVGVPIRFSKVSSHGNAKLMLPQSQGDPADSPDVFGFIIS